VDTRATRLELLIRDAARVRGTIALRLNLAQVAGKQAGHEVATGYFHLGGSSLIDRTGEVTAVIPPRLVFERLRADLFVGRIGRRQRATATGAAGGDR
jgi:hypothetical protein